MILVHWGACSVSSRGVTAMATIYKIVVLGDGGVGKSCLTIQFTQNHFVKDYDPTIENSYRKQLPIDGEPAMLDILDTAGQEEYAVMQDQYISSGQGFLLVYSCTSLQSFQSISELREKILQVKDCETYPMVLCGNKCDLEAERKVSTQQGKDLSKAWDVPFFETSAKTRLNVEEAFIAVVKEVQKHQCKGNVKPKSKPRCTIL